LIQIKKKTSEMKKTMPQIYFMYLLGVITALLTPDFINKPIMNYLTQPFTLAFSNTPGLLKPMQFINTTVTGMLTAVVPSGKVGICISVISFHDGIRVTCLSDSSLMT
jgi:hypothetical protein